MIIGHILFYLGFHFACCPETLNTFMVFLIPVLYLADTTNDYYKWWYTPLHFNDYKNTRFVFVELVVLLGGVAFFFIRNEGEISVFTPQSIAIICIIALGFKHFSTHIDPLFNKMISHKIG